MGYSLQVDDRPGVEVASVGGLRELRVYADKLIPTQAQELHHLLDHGWADNASLLRIDLGKLRTIASADARHTIDAMLTAMSGEVTVVSLTDGMG